MGRKGVAGVQLVLVVVKNNKSKKSRSKHVGGLNFSNRTSSTPTQRKVESDGDLHWSQTEHLKQYFREDGSSYADV